MNYHNQTYDQLNLQNNGYQNVGMNQTQLGQTNPYLNQNLNGGFKNNPQQMAIGMNGMGMNGMAMGAQMNGQMPMIPGFLGGMGGMGMPQMPADPRRFFFNGDEITFNTRFDQMSSAQFQSLNEVVINIRGQQVSTLNTLGLTCTIIWGSFLILPLFLMCMDCWKRCIYPNYELSEKFYSSLSRLSQVNLQSLVLLVTDNNFNKNKAKILYQFVSRQNSLIGFTFLNYASGYNYKQSQYSQFEQNMRPIKKLPIITDLRWYRQVVTL